MINIFALCRTSYFPFIFIIFIYYCLFLFFVFCLIYAGREWRAWLLRQPVVPLWVMSAATPASPFGHHGLPPVYAGVCLRAPLGILWRGNVRVLPAAATTNNSSIASKVSDFIAQAGPGLCSRNFGI